MKRRWIFWLLVIAFLVVVITRLPEIEKLAQTLASGQWEWVLIAAALQVVYYFVITAAYQAAFWTVEVKSRVGGADAGHLCGDLHQRCRALCQRLGDGAVGG